MTNAQLTAALAIAQDNGVRFIDATGKHLEDISIFDGFGLPDFKGVVCTLRQVAFLIRWQCVDILGRGMDSVALNEIANVGRWKFNIVG